MPAIGITIRRVKVSLDSEEICGVTLSTTYLGQFCFAEAIASLR